MGEETKDLGSVKEDHKAAETVKKAVAASPDPDAKVGIEGPKHVKTPRVKPEKAKKVKTVSKKKSPKKKPVKRSAKKPTKKAPKAKKPVKKSKGKTAKKPAKRSAKKSLKKGAKPKYSRHRTLMNFKVEKAEKKEIERRAKRSAKGNVSEYIRVSSLHYKPIAAHFKTVRATTRT